MADNILEFYVQMKDMMSSGLVKLAKNAKETFGTATKSNKDFTLSLGALKTKIDDMKFDRMWTNSKSTFDKMGREIKVLERQLGHLENKNSGGGFMSRITGGLGSGIMGKVAAVASVGAIMAFAGSSVKAAMNYEASGKRFEVLTGSRTEGQDMNARLFALKKNYGLDATANASTMLGFGINSQFIEKDIKELAAVSMGNTLRFKELTLAYSQTMAAGKLIGKDYRQFINAGFNPLQTISEHWKEFGFTTKKTIGELQETIRKGGITASMISKAFEIATGHGGRFAGMMDKMADTTQGKLLKLQGQFEAFKVGIGQALLPTASGLMDTASRALDWMNITKSAPQALITEQGEMNALVHTITELNGQEDLRKQLIGDLIVKYPDFFGKIDLESAKNQDLLDILKQVNDEYDRRIRVATSDEIINTYNKQYKEAQSNFIKHKTQEQLAKSGDFASASGMNNIFQLDWWTQPLHDKDKVSGYAFQAYSDSLKMASIAPKLNAEKNNKGNLEKSNLFQTATDWWTLFKMGDKEHLNQFRSHIDIKHQKDFLKLSGMLDSDGMGNWKVNDNSNISDNYIAQLKAAMYPNKAIKEGADTGAGEEGEGTARGIARGGPRVINIYGVKFIEKLEMHNSTAGESFQELEPKLQEMYLRLLNSGSKMQG